MQLRDVLRQRRRAIAPQARFSAAHALADALMDLPFLPEDGPVAGYWCGDGEISLHSWQLRLPSQLTYCLPILVPGTRILRFAPWKPGDPLEINRYGIPQPTVSATEAYPAEEMALVAVPLVGFDDQGHRLGRGGGWYDATFAFRGTQHPPPWLVGVGFAAQQVDHLRAQPWDVTLDAVCTESATHVFRSESGA